MSTNPLGQQIFADHEFGDGAGNMVKYGFTACPLTFTVSLLTANACGLTFETEGVGSKALSLTFWVLPSITTFAINGDITIPKPQHMQYDLPQQTDVDQDGIAIIQGYTTVHWKYDFLADADLGKLMQYYNPASPQVTINYPNELGIWTQKSAMIEPINLGTRSTIISSGIELIFSKISSD